MSTLFVAPHHDDLALFGAFIAMAYDPETIAVVYGSVIQEKRGTGVTNADREFEERLALKELGLAKPVFLGLDDTLEGRQPVEVVLGELIAFIQPDLVIAPVVEENGHHQHNSVGEVARDLHPQVLGYYTYTNGRDRRGKHLGFEVPYEADMVARKLRALACYESQHGLWSTVHHFIEHPLQEWTDREFA